MVTGVYSARANVRENAHLLDGVSGAVIADLRGHEGPLIAATFNANGTRLVTSSVDNTIRVWGAADGRQLAVLSASGDGGKALALSPDGTRLLEALLDRTVRVRDATNGEEVGILRGHEEAVSTASFSSDGQRVVSASDGGSVRIWDAESGEEQIVIRALPPRSVNSAAFSPDGNRLVTVHVEKGSSTVRIWPVPQSLDGLVAEARCRLPRQLTGEERRRYFLQTAQPNF